MFGKQRQSSAEHSEEKGRAVSVYFPPTVGEVRSHDPSQLPEELKDDLIVLAAMWVSAYCKAVVNMRVNHRE